jgi:hypothetical protein
MGRRSRGTARAPHGAATDCRLDRTRPGAVSWQSHGPGQQASATPAVAWDGAYVALFFAVCGSGYAATRLTGGVKVTCRATRSRKHVSCSVVGTTAGPRGPQGPKGTDGTNGVNGINGINGAPGGDGPTMFTQAPALVDMPLESPSEIGGSTAHVSSVQFCINISGNTNTSYTGGSSVSVDQATVYEAQEPKLAGGAGSGSASGAPAYSAPVPLLQQSYSGQTDIDDCLTASVSTPQAVAPDGYLYLVLTLGLTTDGAKSGQFGTNDIHFDRVTTTFTP